MDNSTMLIIWIALAIVTAIVEAVTVSIVSCWFTAGAIFAIGAYLLGASWQIQFVVFVLVSALTLVIARPIIKKHNETQRQPTNADMNIGQQAVVTEEINNLLGKGQAKIKGLDWSARSSDNETIAVGTTVTVIKIEGVKLIVEPSEKSKEN